MAKATAPRRDIGPLTAHRVAGRPVEIDRNGLEILTLEACFELLATERLGRVGLTIGCLPAILPVAYAVDDQSIVFRTIAGTKLQAIGRGDVVCFQVDHADRRARTGWSVLVIGHAVEVADAAERAELANLGIDPWPLLGADRYIRLATELVSGGRVSDGNS